MQHILIPRCHSQRRTTYCFGKFCSTVVLKPKKSNKASDVLPRSNKHRNSIWSH